MTNTEVLSVLREAVQLVEEYGWIQGFNGDETIGYCLFLGRGKGNFRSSY